MFFFYYINSIKVELFSKLENSTTNPNRNDDPIIIGSKTKPLDPPEKFVMPTDIVPPT